MQQRGKGDPFLDHEKRAEIQTAMEALQHKQVFNLLLAEELQADPDLSKQPRVGRLTCDDLVDLVERNQPHPQPYGTERVPAPAPLPRFGNVAVREIERLL